MKLEEQCCSVELSKWLKILKVKQNSLFFWVKGKIDHRYEGEWGIIPDDNYFLFTETMGVKPRAVDFELYDINKYDFELEYEKWDKERDRLENKVVKDIGYIKLKIMKSIKKCIRK